MSQVSDVWYVRFPDGRVMRAPTTEALRQHLVAGHIPPASRVRRSPDEEWAGLDWTEEFADLVIGAGPGASAGGSSGGHSAWTFQGPGDTTTLASRLDPARLQTVGLRGLAQELFAALDQALSWMKLLTAAGASVVCGAILAVAAIVTQYFPWETSLWLWSAATLLILALVVAAVVPITQMAYVELCRLRPARWNESRRRWLTFGVNLFTAYLLTAGTAAALIFVLRWLPTQLIAAPRAEPVGFMPDTGAAIVTIACMLTEILIWPLVGFTLLLPPIVVIEERNAVSAIWQWWRLVRGHAGRLFLYESATALCGVANFAFALPLALALWGRMDHNTAIDSPVGFTACLLAGLTAAPLLAYLAVAHVFIYLNVRYELKR